ncbi:ATP-binding protein [Maritalea porphyrae]|uniref:sensor histidine kinase n=1 Tax=Maritalea porphyrae TaxID=880732 RepID=UPI0022AF9622|nr:ATP-binding protein [Maritalea porphyrae]MCZ4273270.1 ATP-binding protein [Maritalea porphyrae]
MSNGEHNRRTPAKTILYTALFAALLLGGLLTLFFASFSVFKAVELERAEGRAQLYHSTLLSALERLEHLPFIVAQDPAVVRALSRGEVDGLNQRLEDFAHRSKAEAIYVMDENGWTIAASNYAQEINFLGKNYGFRPYFKDAMAGKRGEFFAIGATTFTPGYFIGNAVSDESGNAIGVVALKIALSELTGAWAASGDDILVTNKEGIVVFATSDQWRYHATTDLSENQRIAIQNKQQFGKQELLPLNWELRPDSEVLLDGTTYLYANKDVEQQGWTLWYIKPTSTLFERTWFVIILATIVMAAMGIGFITFRSNQLQRALKASHDDRQKLIVEIEERKATEIRLEQTRSELARTSKLAALGQLAASITHELGQPISAMRNYLAAEEISSGHKPGGVIDHLNGLVRRMENITKELKFFSMPGDNNTETIDIADLIDGAVGLTKHDLSNKHIDLHVIVPKDLPAISGMRQRLEQVLVNLIRNAIAALQDLQSKRIEIRAVLHDGAIKISVRDWGHGLRGQSIEQLQEPFHTNKPSGEGMGLGLAISAAIVREHKGLLSAIDCEIGAKFTVQLPLT